MFQQSIAQFARNAQKATSIVDDDKLPDRQRGMWSFLTWSFFLAQAVATHEAYAKGHGNADSADADGAGSGHDDATGQKAMSPAGMLGASGFDVDPAAAAQFAAAIAAGLVTPQMWAAFQTDPALFQAFVDQLTGQAASGGAGGAILEEIASAVAAEGEHTGSDGGIHIPGVDLPGIHLPGGITLPIDVAIDLGLELGSDIGLGLHVGGLDDISLNLNVAPILGLHLGFDNGELNLSALGINLASSDGGGALGGLLGALPLSHTLDTLASVTGLGHELVGGPLLGSVTSSLNPVVGSLTHAAAPVTSLAGDALEIVSGTGLVASGGSIVQTLGSALPLHELFANGQHTTYGLELQTSQNAHDTPLSASLSTHLETLDVSAVADHLGHGVGDTVGHLLPSVIEELNLRGFGDGIV